jgi:hypothetical protein
MTPNFLIIVGFVLVGVGAIVGSYDGVLIKRGFDARSAQAKALVQQPRGPTLEATRQSTIDATGATIPGDLPFQFGKADDNSVIALRGINVTKNADGSYSVAPGKSPSMEFPPPTGEYTSFTIDQLNERAQILANELRDLQKRYETTSIEAWQASEGKSGEEKKSIYDATMKPIFSEYRSKLAPQALALASEYMVRLGQVSPPANAGSGAQMIIYQALAGRSPAADEAAFMDYLRDQLSQRNGKLSRGASTP